MSEESLYPRQYQAIMKNFCTKLFHEETYNKSFNNAEDRRASSGLFSEFYGIPYLNENEPYLIEVSRYPAAGKCFKKTRYPAVGNFDQFS